MGAVTKVTGQKVSIPSRGSGLGKLLTARWLLGQWTKACFNPLSGKWFRKETRRLARIALKEKVSIPSRGSGLGKS